MKKLYAIIILMVLVGTMYTPNDACARRDYKCMRDCRAMGYSYGYCKKLCSY